MFERDKVRKEFYRIFPDLKRIKDNPNNYPIIKKWNYRLIKKYRHDVFKYIVSKMEK